MPGEPVEEEADPDQEHREQQHRARPHRRHQPRRRLPVPVDQRGDQPGKPDPDDRAKTSKDPATSRRARKDGSEAKVQNRPAWQAEDTDG
jgi:hypothetical protein